MLLSFLPMDLRMNSAAHTSYCKKTKWVALERVLLSFGLSLSSSLSLCSDQDPSVPRVCSCKFTLAPQPAAATNDDDTAGVAKFSMRTTWPRLGLYLIQWYWHTGLHDQAVLYYSGIYILINDKVTDQYICLTSEFLFLFYCYRMLGKRQGEKILPFLHSHWLNVFILKFRNVTIPWKEVEFQ